MKISTVAVSLMAASFLISGCGGASEGPRFQAMEIPDLEPTPEFWKVRPDQIVSICENVSTGRSEVIATTPLGYPVYAYFWGDFEDDAPQTNWSAGNSSNAIMAYLGEKRHKQTILFAAGVHGAEPESVAAASNLISLLETGKDFRGQSDPELLELCSNYRIIVVPCVNMDGRSLSPDHLRGQPYEVFREACQGRWKDGELIGWKGSKQYFPLPLDKVSYPGGYPNGDGYNIMHDVAPGDMKTEEAKALCRLIARWKVDFVLNGHSCEYDSHMFGPSYIDTPAHIERGCRLSGKINKVFYEKGLRQTERAGMAPTQTLNLSNIVNWCSGGLGLTLECSSSYDNIHNPSICYTFDQLMAPPLVALKVIMEDGLESPLAGRLGGGL